MDIRSGKPYPACALSNFAPHEFFIDGVRCASAEGFLQSLKFKGVDMQEHICSLVGRAAKAAGKDKNWKTTQTLYWRGVEIKRDSDEYQKLLDRAYAALAQNEGFVNALLATHDAKITHSIGKSKINDTVLTEREFCSRLLRLRKELQSSINLKRSGLE